MDGRPRKRYQCQMCNDQFARQDVLKRHIIRRHSWDEILYGCHTCGAHYNTVQKLRIHRQQHLNEPTIFRASETALRGAVKSFSLLLPSQTTDMLGIFSSYQAEIASLIQSGNFSTSTQTFLSPQTIFFLLSQN